MNTMIAVLIFVVLVSLAGALLTWVSQLKISTHGNSASNDNSLDSQSSGDDSLEELIETVNLKLPQTQCAQCGYPGCRPYAEAIIKEDIPINQCPPGGELLIQDLADLLGKEFIALDTSKGHQKPEQVALIIEKDCIGCTLCIVACPVDAIVGASRYMHTVIKDHCTGCELCIPPCPVDCIELIPVVKPLSQWHWPKPQ